MNSLEKLKSRTEWQAYLLGLLTLFLNHFLGWDMSPETLFGIVGGSTGYGLSRGLAKRSSDPDSSAKAPKAAEAAEAVEAPQSGSEETSGA